MPAPLPAPALMAVPLEEFSNEFERLLQRPFIPKAASEFQALLEKVDAKAAAPAVDSEFMRLLEKDVSPRSAAAVAQYEAVNLAAQQTRFLEAVRGAIRGQGLNLAGLISIVAIEFLKEIGRQNREMGTNPAWVDWIIDALDFVATPKALPEPKLARKEAERESCDCCDRLVMLGQRHVRKVRDDVKKASLVTDNNAKRFSRMAVSRRN